MAWAKGDKMASGNVGETHVAGDSADDGAEGLDAALDRAVSSADAVAFLVVSGGDQVGRVYAIRRNTVLVGRFEGADVFVPDPSVSGRHARIIHGPRGFEIEDLQSTNGTFVGGRRIKRSQLRSGDRVSVANLEFTFLLDRPVDATLALMPNQPTALLAPRHRGGATYVAPPMRRALVEEDEPSPSLADLFEKVASAYHFVRGYRRQILAFLAGGAALGVMSALLLPAVPTAVSEVKLLPGVQMTDVIDRGNNPNDENIGFQFFAGAERAFSNPGLVAASLIKVQGGTPSTGEVKGISSRLALEPLGDHLYRASYKDSLFHRGRPEPTTFLSTHLNGYVKSEVDKALKVLAAETDFLHTQMANVEKELARISAEKASFRQQNADQLPEEATQTQTSRFQLESRRADLLAQIRRGQGELEAARRQLAADAPLAATRYQASQVYRDSLAKVNEKLSAAYAQGLADGHPDVVTLLEEKKRIEGLVRNEMASKTNDLDREGNIGLQTLRHQVETLQAQLNAARSDLADTEESLSKVRKVVVALPQVEMRLKELTRAEEGAVKLHDQLFEKLKKAELQLNLERVSAQSRFEVVAPAHLESLGPKKTIALRLTLGLLFGLVVATLYVAAKELPSVLSRLIDSANPGRPRVEPAPSIGS
jgi:hypothetical protein